ncbi:MAG TPA: hypothetical protein VFP12_05740 [Allosphingosinicella sp.]|nr:hypothetical protein [Allosphingosinicella sp.]
MRPLLRLFALAVPALAAVPVSAALPPNYQRVAELKAVLADPKVGGAFPMEAPIERVEYVRPDLYRVSGGRCRLDVAIVDLPTPPGVVGGRRFAVRPGSLACAR